MCARLGLLNLFCPSRGPACRFPTVRQAGRVCRLGRRTTICPRASSSSHKLSELHFDSSQSLTVSSGCTPEGPYPSRASRQKAFVERSSAMSGQSPGFFSPPGCLLFPGRRTRLARLKTLPGIADNREVKGWPVTGASTVAVSFRSSTVYRTSFTPSAAPSVSPPGDSGLPAAAPAVCMSALFGFLDLAQEGFWPASPIEPIRLP